MARQSLQRAPPLLSAELRLRRATVRPLSRLTVVVAAALPDKAEGLGASMTAQVPAMVDGLVRHCGAIVLAVAARPRAPDHTHVFIETVALDVDRVTADLAPNTSIIAHGMRDGRVDLASVVVVERSISVADTSLLRDRSRESARDKAAHGDRERQMHGADWKNNLAFTLVKLPLRDRLRQVRSTYVLGVFLTKMTGGRYVW